MNRLVKTGLLLAALTGAGALLTGCADERRMNDDLSAADFGHAFHEDMAAQIADPDAAYKGPMPASSGERADLAQTRYKNDKVIQPVSPMTSSVGGGGGGGSGGGGGPQ